MAKKKQRASTKKAVTKPDDGYLDVLESLAELVESARRLSARAVNSVVTATYWEIGRRIVEVEQQGEGRADYGEQLLRRLAGDLTARFGRGFSDRSLYKMRLFYLIYNDISPTLSAKSDEEISPTLSAKSAETPIVQRLSGQSLPPNEKTKSQTPTGKLNLPGTGDKKTQTASAQSEMINWSSVNEVQTLAGLFPLSWSHYVRLLSINDENARKFYESETLRGGWSVRQLKRQIDSQFYERALLSKNKAAMLRKGEKPRPEDAVSADEEIKDPLVLEFLGLKDEYSESDLESGLIEKLEEFLLELGGDFTFVGRQKRLRIGDEWYRIDLLFYHRRLRCLVVIDLKVGKFTHADAGQMHMYLNYAAEHWTHEDENPPVGLILCAQHDESLARYALDNLPNKVMAREYKLALPDEQLFIKELERTQFALEHRTRKTES